VTSYSGLRRLWRPPAETLGAIAGVLGSHWRAAATSNPLRLFRANPVSWLKRAAAAAPLTSAPGAADSSDTLPDPHPY
jgi:hypothetical protein